VAKPAPCDVGQRRRLDRELVLSRTGTLLLTARHQDVAPQPAEGATRASQAPARALPALGPGRIGARACGVPRRRHRDVGGQVAQAAAKAHRRGGTAGQIIPATDTAGTRQLPLGVNQTRVTRPRGSAPHPRHRRDARAHRADRARSLTPLPATVATPCPYEPSILGCQCRLRCAEMLSSFKPQHSRSARPTQPGSLTDARNPRIDNLRAHPAGIGRQVQCKYSVLRYARAWAGSRCRCRCRCE